MQGTSSLHTVKSCCLLLSVRKCRTCMSSHLPPVALAIWLAVFLSQRPNSLWKHLLEIHLYDCAVLYCCLLQENGDSWPNVKSIFWPICFLNILWRQSIQIDIRMKNANINTTSIKSLLSLKIKGSLCYLVEKAFAYIFIHDDNIFPNLHILVDYTFPSKENNDTVRLDILIFHLNLRILNFQHQLPNFCIPSNPNWDLPFCQERCNFRFSLVMVRSHHYGIL